MRGRATLIVMTAAAAVIAEELPTLRKLREAVEGALEGKQDAVELALVALLARGHLLIEDVPGVGKTTLARALARAVGGDCDACSLQVICCRATSSASRSTINARASSCFVTVRCSRTCFSRTRSTARARARSPRCSKR